MVGFKRPYFKSEILAKSQPIINLEKMGYSKSDTKYFPEIAYSEQQILHFEQSPHIPYAENRRLKWDWEELHIFMKVWR